MAQWLGRFCLRGMEHSVDDPEVIGLTTVGLNVGCVVLQSKLDEPKISARNVACSDVAQWLHLMTEIWLDPGFYITIHIV